MIIPDDNGSDLKEIPDNIKADLTICQVKWIDEVLAIALEHNPESLSDEEFNRSSGAKDQGQQSSRPSTH